jgi:hypothetical protein
MKQIQLLIAAAFLLALPTNHAAEPQSVERAGQSSVLPEDAFSPVNHVYQFMQAGTCSAWDNGTTSSAKAYLWVPDHCKKLRGLLVLSPNVPEQKLAGDPAIRAACAANDLGIVFVNGLLHFAPAKPGGKKPLDEVDVTAAFLQQLLDGLAKTSGYDEVATVPWLVMGESTNLILVNALLKTRPDRCFAAMWIKNPSNFAAGNLETPGLCAWGTSFEWGQNNSDIRSQWNNVDKVYQGILDGRKKTPNWPISFLVDGSSGHFECSDRLTKYFARYIDAAAKARLTEDGRIKPLDLTKGFVADMPVPGHEGQPVKPATESDALPWFFDEACAREAQSFAEINWKAETQVPAFLDETGKPRPFNFNGIMDIKEGISTEVDGVTFTMRGVMLDKIPENFANAGEPLAHTTGEPEAEWVSGPFVQLGDGKFRLALDRLGGSNGYLALRKGGSDSIRSVVQPAHIEIKPNQEGQPQRITFPAIPNQKAGIASLKLNAVSDSGMPVSYYVNQGPARIVGDTLVMTPIPPRTKFPLKVSVVAWQWGRSTAPAVKTAPMLERSFYLTKNEMPEAKVAEPPVKLSGLKLWLAADSGVTRIDDDMAINWQDMSPSKSIFSVPGVVGNPLWVKDGINGKPVIRFEGNRKTALTIQGVPDGLAGDITVYAVWAAPVLQQDACYGNFGNNRLLSAPVEGGEDWSRGICLTNGTNAVIPPTLTVKTFRGKAPLSDLSLGVMLHVLGGVQAGFFTGDLAELVICTGPVPPAEDAALKSYLSAKYGVQ